MNIITLCQIAPHDLFSPVIAFLPRWIRRDIAMMCSQPEHLRDDPLSAKNAFFPLRKFAARFQTAVEQTNFERDNIRVDNIVLTLAPVGLQGSRNRTLTDDSVCNHRMNVAATLRGSVAVRNPVISVDTVHYLCDRVT